MTEQTKQAKTQDALSEGAGVIVLRTKTHADLAIRLSGAAKSLYDLLHETGVTWDQLQNKVFLLSESEMDMITGKEELDETYTPFMTPEELTILQTLCKDKTVCPDAATLTGKEASFLIEGSSHGTDTWFNTVSFMSLFDVLDYLGF